MLTVDQAFERLAELTAPGRTYSVQDLMALADQVSLDTAPGYTQGSVGRRQRVAALRSFITHQVPRILQVDEVFQFEANQQVTRMEVVEELRKV